ncbi:MAG: hypothetical protein Q7J42_10595 [Sulfuritalea sp.]|nr:hypothetical protein [Sulfuritalea sp.]
MEDLRLPRRHYMLAIVCYLAIPVVMIAGAALASLIDPEMARSHADYARDYHLLELAKTGVVAATAILMLVLWAATCYLVLISRQRSLSWLVLAAAGPFGFIVIALLGDRSPVPGDMYQQFTRKLKLYWRIPLEIVLFLAVWLLAYQCVMLLRDLMIAWTSYRTGIPVASIVAEQNASSGMHAFGEALETFYLVPLVYLLWPVLFNLASRLLKPRAIPPDPEARNSSEDPWLP